MYFVWYLTSWCGICTVWYLTSRYSIFYCLWGITNMFGLPSYTVRKKPKNWAFNEYLLMWWSESNFSLTFEWKLTYTPPHKQIFNEISVYQVFSISVPSCIMDPFLSHFDRLFSMQSEECIFKSVLFTLKVSGIERG